MCSVPEMMKRFCWGGSRGSVAGLRSCAEVLRRNWNRNASLIIDATILIFMSNSSYVPKTAIFTTCGKVFSFIIFTRNFSDMKIRNMMESWKSRASKRERTKNVWRDDSVLPFAWQEWKKSVFHLQCMHFWHSLMLCWPYGILPIRQDFFFNSRKKMDSYVFRE